VKIVLYQPQIPQNTGTIARTCAATGTGLILVRPLGFSTKSRHLKRAGLDYWDSVAVEEVDDIQQVLTPPFFFFSSKASKLYTEINYPADSLLIFGSETAGLPDFLWDAWPDRFFTLPMRPQQRCLNLAVAAGIALYEALKQNQFLLTTEFKKESTRLTNTDEVKGK